MVGETIKQFSHARWSIPVDFLQFSHFERVVSQLDWTSSPGYPYMLSSPTNKDLFKVVNGVPDPYRVRLMWNHVLVRIQERDSDPIRLFIKAEPHKKKKLEEGRYRLISSVSIIDQLVDHLLFSDMNTQMIENWINLPSKVGWSPYMGGWKAMPKSGMALDKSAWDWTMQMWLIDLVLKVRVSLCSNMTDQWKDLATWRYKQLFVNPEFITSGGLVLRQKNPGVMKSGCVNTITDNSIAQVILHNRVCLETGIEPGVIYSMGDDTLQTVPTRVGEYLSAMSSFARVKEPIFKVEFAGMEFKRNGIVEPLYRGKHAFQILHVIPEVLPSLAQSYQLLYHRSQYRDFMENLFLQLGQEIVPRIKRDVIFDGY